MKYWLIKSEPETYSWEQLKKDGHTFWDGVRNYQARNYLKEMKVGDLALYYHSVNEKKVVGVARIKKEWYQDPTTDDEAWVAVDVEPYKEVKKHVTLSEIKAVASLSEMVLVKNSRLSVQPVREAEFSTVIKMAETKL